MKHVAHGSSIRHWHCVSTLCVDVQVVVLVFQPVIQSVICRVSQHDGSGKGMVVVVPSLLIEEVRFWQAAMAAFLCACCAAVVVLAVMELMKYTRNRIVTAYIFGIWKVSNDVETGVIKHYSPCPSFYKVFLRREDLRLEQTPLYRVERMTILMRLCLKACATSCGKSVEQKGFP